jgi:oligosaccharide repeat unit polymerase
MSAITPIKGIRYRLIAIGLGILYYIFFLYCYRDLISPEFAYYGMKFRMLPEFWWWVSGGVALTPLLWLSLDLNRPSDLVSLILYTSLILPSNIIMPMVSNFPPEEVVKLQLLLLVSFALFDFVRQKHFVKILPRPAISWQTMEIAVLSLTISLTLALFYLSGFNLNISLSDSYVRRLDARDIVKGGTIMNYALMFLNAALVPVLVWIGFERNKWTYVALAGIAGLAGFSFTGEKTALLLPIFLTVTLFLISRKRIKIGIWTLVAVTCLVGLSLVEPVVIQSNYISTYFVRREMAMPSQLTTYYWEFFSQNPHVMMTEGLIGKLMPFDPPYIEPKTRLIGYEYFGKIDMNANGNIWASGFADFGYIGMVIVSLIAGFIMNLIDSLTIKHNFLLGCGCCFAIGMIWLNGALQTSLLSNGIAGLIFIMWIMPIQNHGVLERHLGAKIRLNPGGPIVR